MSGTSCTLVGLALLTACAPARQRAATPERSPPARSATQHESSAPSTATLDLLSAAVRQVSATADDPSHRQIIAALRRLAEVVEKLSAPTDAAGIRFAADELDATTEESMEHADLVLRALRDAQHALDLSPVSKRRDVLTALATADDAIGNIEPDRPLLDQQPVIVDALEAVTNAAAVVRGAPPPFGIAEAKPPEPDRSPATALADARKHALALARSGWMDVRPAASSFIADLANVLAACPGTRDQVTKLLLESERLAHATLGGYEEARWIKGALGVAIESLQTQVGGAGAGRDARDAIANIDVRSSLAFQRATIQDAVRATLDAFIARNICGGQQGAGRSP